MRMRVTRRERSGLNASEHTEAVRFMRAVGLHMSQCPELKWLHHIPNGGWRHATVGAKLRNEGLKSGVYDYSLPVARCGHHGLYIEMKSTTGDRSKEQKEFGEFVTAQGYMAVTCRGWYEAYSVVCAYLGISAMPNPGPPSP